MKKTNTGLLAFVRSKIGTAYVYGMKGTVMTQANYEYLKRVYPRFVPSSDESKVGKVCVDCSGLISWYTGHVKNSSSYKAESVAYPIGTISKAPMGAAVWRSGHIGIYAGNGEIIEAMNSKAGTVKTKVKDRDFTHWFLLKDIEYAEEKEMIEKIEIIVDGKKQYIEGIRKDGYVYAKIRDIGNVIGVEVSSQGKTPVLTTK